MSTKTVTCRDYVAGWLDCSINDFLKVLPRGTPAAKYALITCLDSNPHPASLRKKSPELKPLASKARPVGTGLLLPTEVLLEANSRSPIFFGFDELWFFPQDNVEPKPESVGLVGPARIGQAGLDRLGKWMSCCSCSLALGDGEGLNFIIKAQGLVRCLLALSLDQPEPAVTPFETEAADSA